jgi:hypothetical protein
MDTKGVIVGADQNQEWLLPWWWSFYKQHCNYPVAFFDFGMSAEGVKFCQDRGVYFKIEEIQFEESSPKEEVLNRFNLYFGLEQWKMRKTWLKKPLAFLKTPFDQSVWIDIDCQILRPIDGIFELLAPEYEMVLAGPEESELVFLRLINILESNEVNYNSGVVVFRKNSPLIQEWVDACLSQQNEFIGDDVTLSKTISLSSSKVQLLPKTYNCTTIYVDDGMQRNEEELSFEEKVIQNPHIRHFMTTKGKEYILQNLYDPIKHSFLDAEFV